MTATDLASEIESASARNRRHARRTGSGRGQSTATAAMLADFVLAIVGIALTLRSSCKLNAAIQLRQTAMDGIEHELTGLQAKLPWLSHRAINPLGTALPAMLIPLVAVIIRGPRKHRAKRQ